MQPLTFEDVLHPQEGDFIMQNTAHNRDVVYLQYAFKQALNGRQDVRVWADLRTDWEVEGVRPHGPDVGVFEGMKGEEPVRVNTYMVKEDGARPALVVEVTSESTRTHDLISKVKEYHQAGVPLYAIVDYVPEADFDLAVVLGYRWTEEGFVRLPLNDDGRLWLGPVSLWLGWENGRAVCYDADYNRVLEPIEVKRRNNELEDQLEDEVVGRREAEKRAKDEERQRLDAERRATDLAARLAELEAKLRGDAGQQP
jgi:colicin import membrane protein